MIGWLLTGAACLTRALCCRHQEVLLLVLQRDASVLRLFLLLHRHVDFLAELLNVSDLAVSLLDHCRVFRGLHLTMEILLQCFQMLVHLLEHVHMSLNVSSKLLDFTLLCNDYLSALSFRLQPAG